MTMMHAEEPRFHLSGGALCLDFANTWGDRNRPESDGLCGYDDLLAFARQAGVLSGAASRRLARHARQRPAERDAAFEQALALRDTIFRLLRYAAVGDEPRAQDLGRLNRLLPDALCCLEVARSGAGYAWSWSNEGESLASPLWRVVHSAAELLAGEELDRVRACDGATCTWLFLDRSRNRSRRWCDMATCGNRAKARRHYRRRQQNVS